jgi:hypothetical protein
MRYMREYFGEADATDCDHCDNCVAHARGEAAAGLASPAQSLS